MSNKPQAQPLAAHAQPVDPGTPKAQGYVENLQDVSSQVVDLASRVNDVEQKIGSVTDQLETAGANEPVAGPALLQNVLPDIKKLSEKVGGLQHLAEIVDALRQPNG